MAAEAPHQFYNQFSKTAEGILTTLCDDMKISGNTVGQPQYAIMLAGEHMRTIRADGWPKADIRKFVCEHAQNSIAQLKRTQRLGGPSSRRTKRRSVPWCLPGRHSGRRRRRPSRRLFGAHSGLGEQTRE